MSATCRWPVQASFEMGTVILAVAGLSFIGFGAQPPTPEWGVMIADGRNFIQDGSTIQLQDEALKDLVRFFADADQMDEAIEYFTKLGRADLIRSTLKKLAATFFEQGKFERSIDMYRRLINDQPTAKDKPEYQSEIITAYKKLGDRPKVLDEINRLRTEYGPNTAWQRTNAADPRAIEEANAKIESSLRSIA